MKCPLPTRTLPFAIALLLVSATAQPSPAHSFSAATRLSFSPRTPAVNQPLNGRLARSTLRFIPPKPPQGDGPSGRPRGGASRDMCPAVTTPLTALVPWSAPAGNQSDPTTVVWGTTLAQRPTFWFYVPYEKKPAYRAEFVLQDSQNSDVYRSAIALPNTPGVIRIPLPASIPALNVSTNYQSGSQLYRWYFRIYCSQKETAQAVLVQGTVQRISPDTTLAQKLAKAKPVEQMKLYVDNGIWFDALTTLATLRLAQPNDKALKEGWQSLLESIGVEAAIANAPLVK